MEESQVAYVDLMKDVHEVHQFTIVKVASCTSRLDLLDCELERCGTRVAQSIANFEVLEKRVAVVEEVLVQSGWHEMRTELQTTNEKIVTMQGNWKSATAELEEIESEIINV